VFCLIKDSYIILCMSILSQLHEEYIIQTAGKGLIRKSEIR